MAFSLETLTEEFFDSIVLFSFCRPNPHMDTAGCIIMVAEDGIEYFIDACYDATGFEYKFEDWPDVFPMFSGLDYRWMRTPSLGVQEKWRLVGDCIVRADFAQALQLRLEETLKKGKEAFLPAIAAEVLGFEYKAVRGKRVVYEKSLEAYAIHQGEHDAIARHREKVKLTSDDVEWERIEDTSVIKGFNLKLAEKHKDGSILAHLYTIEEERAYEPGKPISSESPVETYNLFSNTWHNVADPVEMGHDGRHLTDRGHFVRSFTTLEKAKRCVLDSCPVTKENRIDADKVFAPPTPRKLVLAPNEQAERYLTEARRLAKLVSGFYIDAKRYLLRTEKLRKSLSEANVCWLDTVWKELGEAAECVIRDDDPPGV